jgi:hypothetical protein
MKVLTNQLPDELVEKLPVAFQISEEFDTELITDPVLRYEIERFIKYGALDSDTDSNLSSSEKIYEIVPEVSYKKHGTTIIGDEEEFIVLLIRNHLRIPKGSYIFDPEVGTKIYEYLKYLDLGSIRESLYFELKELVNSAVHEFNISKDIEVENVYLVKEDKERSSDFKKYKGAVYSVYIELKIGNEIVEISDEFEL